MGHEFNTSLGKAGEDAAEVFLEDKGYKILARNFRERYGELDLVAKKDNWLVFVEVKLKHGEEFGTASEMVTYRKIRKILKTAQRYMMQNNIDPENTNWRVDVITVEFQGDQRIIEHLENAVTF